MDLPQQVDLAHAVDDDVAVPQVGEVSGIHGDAVGQVRGGVPQVLDLAGQLLLLPIHQHQLVRNALDRQGVRHMGAHMAQTDDADFSRFHMKFLHFTLKINRFLK